ncbi:unnamed protein product [Symbiodinium microadriaticum]|nr:unnamed protein product [Symbiodinium microadriaticum]
MSLSLPKVRKSRLQRQINDVEYGQDFDDFSAMCEAVAETPWAREFRLSPIVVEALIVQNKLTCISSNGRPTRLRRRKEKAVNFDQLSFRMEGRTKRPFCVSYGMGVDSTALLIHLARQYAEGRVECRPDLITFADTGNEKKETYAYLPVIQDYLKSVGFPELTIVRYEPGEGRVKNGMYYTLEQNCLVNKTLPSLAFGFKKCSLKWKRMPQDKCREQFQPCIDAWADGQTAIVAIGYDAGPKDQRRADVMDDDQYTYWYPLIELGWDREQCIAEIVKEGLPGWTDERGVEWVESGGQPVKSACWFCPSNKPWELDNFSLTEHGRDYLRAIVRMEDNAAPNLEKIDGLWRTGTKGTRGGEKKPGRMADYIQERDLLGGGGSLPIIDQFDFDGCEECAGRPETMMYFDPGLIRPIDLSDERKQELACVMADAYRHLKRAAKKRYSDPDIRQLRADWRQGRCNLRTDWQARDSMQNLERIESEVIAGYIRIAHSLCKAFYYAHSRCSAGVTMDDFVQEASFAIFNSMYSYDGSTEFSTFCYRAIKNKLVDFVRTDRSFSKINRKVILWRFNVIRLMNRRPDLSFEQALVVYQEQREEKNLRTLTDDELESIHAAYRATNLVRDNIMDETLFVVVDDDDDEVDERVEELQLALTSSLLSDDEHKMVELFLSGEVGWQTRLAESEGVTRAAINQRWQRTQNKLREAIEERKAA